MSALTAQTIAFVAALAACGAMHVYSHSKNPDSDGWAIIFVLVLICGWPK